MTPHPSPLPRLRANVLEAWAVWIGIESGLFDAVATPTTEDRVQAERGFDPSALHPLLEALIATGHIDRDGETIALSAASAPFLQGSTRGAPDPASRFIGRSFGFLRTAKHFESYPRLLQDGGGLELSPSDWGHVTMGSTAYVPPAIDAMVTHVPALSASSPPRVLDVGCGSGDYTLELVGRIPGLSALAIDPTPAVAETTQRRLAGCPRVEVRCCGVEDVTEMFDVVLLNHVVHVVGEAVSRRILDACRARLHPGGQLVVQELVKTPHNKAELFGLMMRLLFPAGDAYTRAQVEQMARDAGFTRTRHHALGPPSAGLSLVICDTPTST